MTGRDAILEQHRSLRRLLAEIEGMLSSHARLHPTALSARLAGLEEALEAHFAQEEDSGLFRQIAEASPEAAPSATLLMIDHRRLRARTARLRAATARGRVSAVTARAVRALLRDLERHEERENELLLDVVETATAAQD